MIIYQEILNWSINKSLFIRDALRRIITTSVLTNNDFDEITQLLKKDCGDTSIVLNAIPLDISHIPMNIITDQNYPKLVSISNPVNICALHDEGCLEFNTSGLTIIYGKNGSGKSSYSRILKKLCWSRNSNIELKKNVFTSSTNQQKIEFKIKFNEINEDYLWLENSPSNPLLNSFFVFDNECGNTYINSENPTQYKPVGIDVLEKLISTFTNINHDLNNSLSGYNTQKPILPLNLLQTNLAQWYKKIEQLSKDDIDIKIQFNQEENERKKIIANLISNQNPKQDIINLNNQKLRINSYIQQFQSIERNFNNESIHSLIELKGNFETINRAYQLASYELENINTLNGFGTNPWRTLWESAKNFAHNSNLTDGENFPSLTSLEKCVLCQQELDEVAKHRLIQFNQFVLNDISNQLNSINLQIQQKINIYNSLVVPSIEIFTELEQILPNFTEKYSQFHSEITFIKISIISFLKFETTLNVELQTITPFISTLIPNIDYQIEQSNQLLQNSNNLTFELNELIAKEFLFEHKSLILQYIEEYNYKSWINYCQSKLSTNSISRKIGELMENQAISFQHREFISHLNSFNPDLATKVLISRSRTSQGNTYQKCAFNNVNDPINSILSEGEQKIIALSNFLAECTIDNRLNTIILDDPVTSLDMDYRDLISNKIVQLSQERQIIIFTHDLSFLRLLIDTHKSVTATDCVTIGIDRYDGVSGIVTDEIPFLAKNIQERIESIRRILAEHDALGLTDAHGREIKLDSARKRFRMLLERSVEEILSNKTYERFSKNINFKKNNLSSYIVTDQSDVDFLLGLFSKYSVTEHDGGTTTIPLLPNKASIDQDIRDFFEWKETFKTKLKTFRESYV